MMKNILPELTSRSLFLGQTGSGKTYTGIEVLRQFVGIRQIVILDTKGDDNIGKFGGPIVEHLVDLNKYEWPETEVIIYRPCGEELAKPEVYLDGFCQWIYDRGHTIVFIDELTQLSTSTTPKAGFLNLLTRGRSRDCTVLMGTQRPAGIPRIAFTETQFFYRFYLSDKEDRTRVAQFTNPEMLSNPRSRYGFIFYRAGERRTYEINSI